MISAMPVVATLITDGGENMDDHHDRSLHGHDKQLEKLIPILPDDNIAENAAEIFSLLSDGTRLKILWLLCHCEECVCDIAEAVVFGVFLQNHALILDAVRLALKHILLRETAIEGGY